MTDIISFLNQRGQKVAACLAADARETMGINDRLQLSQAQEYLTRRILERHMLNGVTIEDPASTLVEPGVEIGRDTVLYRGTVLTLSLIHILFLRISVHEEEKRQKIFSSTKFPFKFPIYV